MASVCSLVVAMVVTVLLYQRCDVPFESAYIAGVLLYIGYGIAAIGWEIRKLREKL